MNHFLYDREPEGAESRRIAGNLFTLSGNLEYSKTFKKSLEMGRFNKVEFLLQPRVLSSLRDAGGLNLAEVEKNRGKIFPEFSVSEGAALVEQLFLRDRARNKFSHGDALLYTKTGLEQMTRESIARYKAVRIGRRFRRVADLCCGLGGDSFYLQADEVVGVDWDWDVLKLYRHNLRAMEKNPRVVLGDASMPSLSVDAVLLDPSRRRGSANRWGPGGLSPDMDSIEKILPRYHNAAVKLGPGTDLPEFLWEGEVEYIGVRDTCLEAVVWTGELGRPGAVSAAELDSGFTLSRSREEIADSFQRVEEPGDYLFEPVKTVVRSHLFGCLAMDLNLWQIDSRTAYLSGNEPLVHPLLKAYKIEGQFPFNFKTIRKALEKRKIHQVEIKKRGLVLDPEKAARELRVRGGGKIVLIFTRCANRKTAFLARSL